jgi:hypothetical protein
VATLISVVTRAGAVCRSAPWAGGVGGRVLGHAGTGHTTDTERDEPAPVGTWTGSGAGPEAAEGQLPAAARTLST